MHMEEITKLANLPVYTREGTFVGTVKNLVLDLPGRRIEGILIGRTNPNLVEEGRDVSIPYRWVQSFNDILLLRHFPGRVSQNPAEDAASEAKAKDGEAAFEEVQEPVPPQPPAKRPVARRA